MTNLRSFPLGQSDRKKWRRSSPLPPVSAPSEPCALGWARSAQQCFGSNLDPEDPDQTLVALCSGAAAAVAEDGQNVALPPWPPLTIMICKLTGRAAVVLFMLITITGVAGQSCCAGTATSRSDGTVPAFGTTASDCKSPDFPYVIWQLKTCPLGQKCRPFTCTVSTVGVILKTMKYQDCYDDTTFKADMQAKSINSYKCIDGTSSSAGIKASLMAVLVASAAVLSLIL
jgi:hypothetical protein